MIENFGGIEFGGEVWGTACGGMPEIVMICAICPCIFIYILVVFVWRGPHARVIKCRCAFLSNVAVVIIIVQVVSCVLVTTLY